MCAARRTPRADSNTLPHAPGAGEDGYESATSELHYPDGIVSPIGSPLSSGLDTLAVGTAGGRSWGRLARARPQLACCEYWLPSPGQQAALQRAPGCAMYWKHHVCTTHHQSTPLPRPPAALPPQLAELDVIQPEPPTTGCIGKRPPGASKLYVCTSRPRAGSSVRVRGPAGLTWLCRAAVAAQR